MLSSDEYGSYIGWSPDGRSVEVRDVEGFEDEVMHNYFKTKSYRSFVRSLHMYNFSKVDQNSFWHMNFQRGRPDLLVAVKRKASGELLFKGPGVLRSEGIHRTLDDVRRQLASAHSSLHKSESQLHTVLENCDKVQESNVVLWQLLADNTELLEADDGGEGGAGGGNNENPRSFVARYHLVHQALKGITSTKPSASPSSSSSASAIETRPSPLVGASQPPQQRKKTKTPIKSQLKEPEPDQVVLI